MPRIGPSRLTPPGRSVYGVVRSAAAAACAPALTYGWARPSPLGIVAVRAVTARTPQGRGAISSWPSAMEERTTRTQRRRTMPDDQPLSPPYDPKKYRLGTLCKRGHVYGGARHADGSPGSLRELAGSNCVVCKA